jgi:hypothetical protein
VSIQTGPDPLISTQSEGSADGWVQALVGAVAADVRPRVDFEAKWTGFIRPSAALQDKK